MGFNGLVTIGFGTIQYISLGFGDRTTGPKKTALADLCVRTELDTDLCR